MQYIQKKDSASTTVCDWSLEPAKLNSTFSRVARRSLPSAPASHTFSQDTLRRWERAFREQSVMCNQTAGLSMCLTKVQDSMVTQLKSLRVDKAKGKTAEKTQQAVEEFEYLLTVNRSISRAMQCTMQDLSAGVFISMANLTLACRDSSLEFICGGVKPDTLTALCTAPFIFTHCFQTVYWSRLKMKSHVVRRGILLAVHTGSLDVFTHTLPQVADQFINRTGSPLHRPGSKLETGKWDRKVVAKPQTSPKSRPRVQRKVNDNYCVLNVAGMKDSVHVNSFVFVFLFQMFILSPGCHKRKA